MNATMPPNIADMAARIYIELATRVTLAPAQADKAKPAPEVLARMSFKLAEAFVLAASERGAAPVVQKYEVKLSDVGGL